MAKYQVPLSMFSWERENIAPYGSGRIELRENYVNGGADIDIEDGILVRVSAIRPGKRSAGEELSEIVIQEVSRMNCNGLFEVLSHDAIEIVLDEEE